MRSGPDPRPPRGVDGEWTPSPSRIPLCKEEETKRVVLANVPRGCWPANRPTDPLRLATFRKRLRSPVAAATQALQLPPATRSRLSPKPHHEVSSHDQRPTRPRLRRPNRDVTVFREKPLTSWRYPVRTAALARSNHNASAAVTARDKSPAFTGSSPRDEVARPSTDTPRCIDHGRDFAINQGKPARRVSDEFRAALVLLPVLQRDLHRDAKTKRRLRRTTSSPTETRHRGDAST